MYVITTIIVICVVLLFLRGLYLSYLDSLREDVPPPHSLTNEGKLRAAYRNAYFANLSLSDDEWKALASRWNSFDFCSISRDACIRGGLWIGQNSTFNKLKPPKQKLKNILNGVLKLLFTATGITVAFFALIFLGFESVETKEQQEIQMWCNEYMPELSIRACMDEAGL